MSQLHQRPSDTHRAVRQRGLGSLQMDFGSRCTSRNGQSGRRHTCRRRRQLVYMHRDERPTEGSKSQMDDLWTWRLRPVCQRQARRQRDIETRIHPLRQDQTVVHLRHNPSHQHAQRRQQPALRTGDARLVGRQDNNPRWPRRHDWQEMCVQRRAGADLHRRF